MIQAAITPMAETQRVCIRWLLRYFELYGDDSPNKDEVIIQVMLKKDVYELYRRHMTGQHREFVGLERFYYDIWNVIYPRHRKRLPGSCDTCYEIDRLRRQENDNHTAQMLKDAHLMHRGGLFMLELGE